METINTVLHTYSFDVRTPEGKTGWGDLQKKLITGPECHGPVLGDCYNFVNHLDGVTIELETTHLFNNQWNTAPNAVSGKGLRVFDWALECLPYTEKIKRGHYLEQTPQMREVRRNTMVCGYCGKQEPAAKGYVFCPHCIDSEYLTEKDLKITRMRPGLMDRSFRTDNVIYYSHTDKFSFGWRTPLDADTKSALLDVISEFPFEYELKEGRS